ncbi:MAG: DNA-directed RNA polymerase [Nanoarchaeota archaeon]|nr:DNA-directed RNA polymerase [Nanoarchaeota archaeon]MBU4284200.1 DNA-directed RNA polymerase [Nanoarchaeota archaeon]
MFYKTQLKDHIRVPPHLFGLKLEDAMLERIKKKYEGYISKELGIVIDVSRLDNIGEGIIIPGDGASYYETEFEIITFKPEMQEVVLGRIKDIADFGAFISIGPIEGMIHISQTMDDFVSFNKEKTLAGKESKKVLKIGDKCRARIIAVSYKDVANPKLGLTMRQTGLGKLEWIEEKFEQKTDKKPEKKSKKKSRK